MRATYKELAKAFYDAGRRELVDEICNIVSTQAVHRAGQQRAEGNVLKMSASCIRLYKYLVLGLGKNCHSLHRYILVLAFII